jgi:hypothetical protein
VQSGLRKSSAQWRLQTLRPARRSYASITLFPKAGYAVMADVSVPVVQPERDFL